MSSVNKARKPKLPRGARGRMRLVVGPLRTYVYGGPYMSFPSELPNFVGVKMAAEIDRPCTVSVPTQDFSTPDVTQFKLGLLQALMLMRSGRQVYVGCMGGIGRTGLFLGGLAKVMSEYRRKNKRRPLEKKFKVKGLVQYVRDQYLGHAIETSGQQEYLRLLDVSDIVETLWLADRKVFRDGSKKRVSRRKQVVVPVAPAVGTMGFPLAVGPHVSGAAPALLDMGEAFVAVLQGPQMPVEEPVARLPEPLATNLLETTAPGWWQRLWSWSSSK